MFTKGQSENFEGILEQDEADAQAGAALFDLPNKISQISFENQSIYPVNESSKNSTSISSNLNFVDQEDEESSTKNSKFDEDSDNYIDDEDDDEYQKENDFSLPEYACSYCGIHDTACVVQCNFSECKKWFCNGKSGTNFTSHIITHLVHNKHKEVSLHADSILGETVLECYQCGSKNVFTLGFITAKSDNVVVILCREPCAQQKFNISNDSNSDHTSVLGDEWDTSKWQPLIEERSFLSWLVKIPNEQESSRSRKVNLNIISKLEESWKLDPETNVEQVLNSNLINLQPDPVLNQFDDAFEYKDIFETLVELEAQVDKKIKESQAQEDVNVRWDVGLNQKPVAWFSFSRSETDIRIVLGDPMRLRLKLGNYKEWVSEGNVIKLIDDQVALELNKISHRYDNNQQVPIDKNSGFRVELVWNSTTFDRMNFALFSFKSNRSAVSNYIYNKILGKTIADEIDVSYNPKLIDKKIPNFPDLNPSQLAAVKSVITNPFSLIQGPPGTGKTVTSAAIVYHFTKKSSGPVLVCAPSNVAVDHLTERIHRTGVRVIRVVASSRESIISSIDSLTLHKQISDVLEETSKIDVSTLENIPKSLARRLELTKLKSLKDDQGELSFQDRNRYKKLMSILQKEILDVAQVICTTCIGAGDFRLKQYTFECVLIDESTQSSEPESLVSITKGSKQVVLVGDHCQLGPVIMSRHASNAGLSQSLFERLIKLGTKPIRLNIQYRMHPCLSEWPSNTFYEGSLQNGVTAQQRSTIEKFNWPDSNKPMFFFTCIGQEEISASTTSYLNRAEAMACERILSAFTKAGIKAQQIGVITPYEGQRAHLVNNLVRNTQPDFHQNLEISSVDSFQGREKDYIIFSCVRSNDSYNNANLNIGFLSDPRRLNVAITRAKYGLIILGNPKLLSKDPLWNSFLSYFYKHNCLLEGTLKTLKPSSFKLPIMTNPYIYTIQDRLEEYTQKHMIYKMQAQAANDAQHYSYSQNLSEYKPNKLVYGKKNSDFDKKNEKYNSAHKYSLDHFESQSSQNSYTYIPPRERKILQELYLKNEEYQDFHSQSSDISSKSNTQPY